MGDEAAPGRKDWIENRLKELDQIFAVSVGGFSLMDNHLHLLLRGVGVVREGMRTGFTLGQYLMLVEYTGRILRDGKAAISSEVADIFARLGSTPETWGVRMAKLTGGRLLGRFLAASRERLRQLASKLQVRHLANVG